MMRQFRLEMDGADEHEGRFAILVAVRDDETMLATCIQRIDEPEETMPSSALETIAASAGPLLMAVGRMATATEKNLLEGLREDGEQLLQLLERAEVAEAEVDKLKVAQEDAPDTEAAPEEYHIGVDPGSADGDRTVVAVVAEEEDVDDAPSADALRLQELAAKHPEIPAAFHNVLRDRFPDLYALLPDDLKKEPTDEDREVTARIALGDRLITLHDIGGAPCLARWQATVAEGEGRLLFFYYGQTKADALEDAAAKRNPQ